MKILRGSQEVFPQFPPDASIVQLEDGDYLQVLVPVCLSEPIHIDIGLGGKTKIIAPAQVVESINGLPSQLIGWSVKQVIAGNSDLVSSTDLCTDLIDLLDAIRNPLRQFIDEKERDPRFGQIDEAIKTLTDSLTRIK